MKIVWSCVLFCQVACSSSLFAIQFSTKSNVSNDRSHASVTMVALRPDGKVLAKSNGSMVNLESASGLKVASFPAGGSIVTGMAFSPDGSNLAIATGEPGRSGKITIYSTFWVRDDKFGAAKQTPQVLFGPSDVLYDIAFSPKGNSIAGACYDHGVYVWNLNDSKNLSKPRIFADHTDSVAGVSFSSDGTLLATCGADRTVKIWDTVNGKRLYTLNESTGELNSVAFRKDGKQVAAGGSDKSIRIWSVSKSGGTLQKVALAHSGSILRVRYLNEGASIMTASEDGSVKQFSSTNLQEEKVLARLPGWANSVSTDGSGVITVLSDSNGKTLWGRSARSLNPAFNIGGRQDDQKFVRPPVETPANLKLASYMRPKTPTGATFLNASLGAVSPNGVRRGTKTTLTFFGDRIGGATSAFFDDPGIVSTAIITNTVGGNTVKVEASISSSVRIGIHNCYLQTPFGTTAAVPFAVGNWQEIGQIEPNDSISQAQKISLPVTVIGAIDTPGDVDSYSFVAKTGQEIVFDLVARQIRSRLQPVVTLTDSLGKVLMEKRTSPGNPDVHFGFKVPSDGTYMVRIRDFEGTSGGDVIYRLNIGEFPMVTSVFPLGARSGIPSELKIEGFNLHGVNTVKVIPPSSALWSQTTPVTVPGVTDLWLTRNVAIGSDPETITVGTNRSVMTAQVLPNSTAVSGKLTSDSPDHYYRFPATKGQRLIIDTMASRLGSPLDSQIEILTTDGKPVERATLRAVSQTESTLNDRDSVNPAMRLLAWDDFHLNDYVMVGRDIMRIQTLPKGPDDDCVFRSQRGMRLGYLGSTPEFHSLGSAVYKAEIHPPGSKFAPNGYPLVHVYYKNDDGGPLFGRDSHLEFDPPNDGDFVVHVADSRGKVIEASPYRLMIHKPRPDFKISVSPSHPNVPRSGSALVNVEVERYDGFDSPIDIASVALPSGWSATTSTIEPGETSAILQLSSKPYATTPPSSYEFQVIGTAKINGKIVSRQTSPDNGHRLLTLLPRADLDATTDRNVVRIRPGETTVVRTDISRNGTFGLRVPIEVKNLPYGVRVMNIGLNGVLVTENENYREFTLYCEPWVTPQERMISVQANVEGGVPNIAPAVLLKVEKGR